MLDVLTNMLTNIQCWRNRHSGQHPGCVGGLVVPGPSRVFPMGCAHTAWSEAAWPEADQKDVLLHTVHLLSFTMHVGII